MEGSKNSNFEMEAAAEESGWTTYLEDFSMKQRENNSSCNSDSFGSPSLLSDAASHAAWKINCNTNNTNQIPNACSPPPMGGSPFLKRLNLKNKRNKKISDPDLEDTASSPVNSPKVSSFKQMDTNYRTENSSIGYFQGNEGGSGQIQEMQTVEINSTSFDEKNNGYIELKKKGLCLVPWSMIVNHHG
ncbi:vascular-related unknown protein 1-like [Nicotiana tomentosiformis]|uniref:Uncharacterized protein n=1 Tax=Nicotiana tabacum TaxID=4097 RepID=A0A1S3YNC6_TOBAC|nr:vascular-related unknown protein 1-like [Nicotiana tomentosiformis]XP_016453430.1 PREDICTED: uncharacterized protein LOC107777795 [Nicotiana tabacum]